MIKKACFILLFFITSQYTQAQIVKTALPDTTASRWEKVNKVGLDFTQIAFVNWSAGGNNSISGLIKGHFIRAYKYNNMKWNNELLMRYGLNKQENQDVRKTDDAFLLNSTIGYRKDSISNWFYGGKFTFQTQFSNGYSYPNVEKAISKLFAPAYVFVGIGAEYARKDLGFTLYLSPLTQKTTIVLDKRLSNEGAFGVAKAIYDTNGTLLRSGGKSRTELGTLISGQFKREIAKNMVLDTRATLYTDYLNKFGNIDIDWFSNIEMTVNKYVKANVGLHVMYDDDIKSKKEENGIQVTRGPRIQLKQIIGVGVLYTF
ncbi:DUF3078 domain-containing protein [Flavobacterium sp. 20NA77.7]|uniref:DUF3078 domain-containing protein n=1 Tax=Flavobacterium nakdongensis TaxID=3073563 RepID=A0ABY9R8K2_9FLAO|nr:DUF3078 domain-containing protein [Flavobacterium sp. 20NA77.7]WMW77601.1 DUF3078 domain-containing protein [Flavobacterium sp. 20NA77.7]